VAEELAPLTQGDSGPGALVILRSGAYVAHDEGFYRERTPYNRSGSDVAGVVLEGELRAALEVWAQVLSVPEPGLALVGMGKRDVPYDLDLPFVRAVRRGGPTEAGGSASDAPDGMRDGMRVTKVQDQHAYLSIEPGVGLRPGDLVSFGISHPCTAFDKWRVIPVVDDDYVVIDLIKTYF
jgi:D-serine deaminase-like pyridoxal phosphate-dependent protein